jgi:AraC-like DNA-binding protein
MVIYFRLRESEEYLYFSLKFLGGLFVFLEACNYWNMYGTLLNRFRVLLVAWAALLSMHALFIHRLYGIKRKKFEKLVLLYPALTAVMAPFASAGRLRVLGLAVMAISFLLCLYVISCNVRALRRSLPNGKLFGVFGIAVFIGVFHDGLLYLFRFAGLEIPGVLFPVMILPGFSALLYAGLTLVLVTRFFAMKGTMANLKTAANDFFASNTRLSDHLLEAARSKGGSASHTINDRTEEKILQVMGHIEKNFTRDLTREGLASLVNIHPDNLGRMFKQYAGRKLGDYVNELRVNEAARRLVDSEENIIHIAFLAGFDSLRTFNRAFLKIMQISPEVYRKNNRPPLNSLDRGPSEPIPD